MTLHLLERRPGDAWLSTRYAVTRIEQGDCAAGQVCCADWRTHGIMPH